MKHLPKLVLVIVILLLWWNIQLQRKVNYLLWADEQKLSIMETNVEIDMEVLKRLKEIRETIVRLHEVRYEQFRRIE